MAAHNKVGFVFTEKEAQDCIDAIVAKINSYDSTATYSWNVVRDGVEDYTGFLEIDDIGP